MKVSTKVLLASALLTSSSMAAAEVTFSGNVAMTTDYVYRGISQTDSGAAVQGGFDLSHSSGFYAGVWASNLDFGDDADIEIDYYFGIGGEFSNKIGYDIGVIYYGYPDSSDADNGDYDFTEVYGGLSYDFGPAALSGSLAYSSDFFGTGTGDATYLTVGLDIPLPSDFALSLHYGTSDIDGENGNADFDYDDWKIGLSKSYGGFDFALDYTDTDLSDDNDCGGANVCDDRFVFTVSKSL